MIETTKAFRVGENTFGTLAEAQTFELKSLVTDADFGGAPVGSNFADLILKHKDKIIDILTTGPRSKPKARAINGGRKSRKPAGHPTHIQIQTNPPTVEKL